WLCLNQVYRFIWSNAPEHLSSRPSPKEERLRARGEIPRIPSVCDADSGHFYQTRPQKNSESGRIQSRTRFHKLRIELPITLPEISLCTEKQTYPPRNFRTM